MKLITSIHKLPLEKFIDCFVDHDYSGLVIEGDVPEALLFLTWNDLVEQYNDALKDDNQKHYISAFQEYQKLKSKHDMAVRYMELLHYYFTQGIVVTKWIKELNKLCQNKYVFNPGHKEDFITYLENCASRNGANMMHYQLAELKLLELQKAQSAIRDKKNIKADRGYFTTIMINLKNHFSREIPYTVSTYEFCTLVNYMNEDRKILEAQKQKHGRR